MKSITFIPMLHLQLFADGGAAGAAGDGGTAQGQGATAGAASQQTTGAKNSLSDVKYGIQPEESAPAAEVKQETAEHTDPEAEFEALIKGKFKSQYDTRVQNTIQNRLKGSKEIAEKFNDAAPILEFLAKKYGVDAKDVKALRAAFEDDEAHYEKEAMELDMPVEQVKKMHKVNRENDELRRTVQHMQAKEEADRRLAVWMQQEEATKKVYPNFDMEAELKNPQFVELINNNIDVKTAFEVLHHDEIFPAAMQYTAKAVEEKIAKKIAANGARPSENGTGARASAVVKSDVSKLTKYDIDEVARRVARGERVTFG